MMMDSQCLLHTYHFSSPSVIQKYLPGTGRLFNAHTIQYEVIMVIQSQSVAETINVFVLLFRWHHRMQLPLLRFSFLSSRSPTLYPHPLFLTPFSFRRPQRNHLSLGHDSLCTVWYYCTENREERRNEELRDTNCVVNPVPPVH